MMLLHAALKIWANDFFLPRRNGGKVVRTTDLMNIDKSVLGSGDKRKDKHTGTFGEKVCGGGGSP